MNAGDCNWALGGELEPTQNPHSYKIAVPYAAEISLYMTKAGVVSNPPKIFAD